MKRHGVTAITLLLLVGLVACGDDEAQGPSNDVVDADGVDAARESTPERVRRHRTGREETPEAESGGRPEPPAALDGPALLELLHHPDHAQRLSAREQLRKLPEVDPAWLDAFARDIRQLGSGDREILLRFGPDAIERLVEVWLEDLPRAGTHVSAVLAAFAEAGHGDRVAAALRRMADRGDQAERSALDALSRAGPRGRETLAQLLAEGRPCFRLPQWAQGLRADAAPLIRARIVGAGGEMPADALAAVRHLDGAGAAFVPDLEALLERTPNLAGSVASALRGVGPAGLPLLERLLGHDDVAVRQSALRSAARLGADAHVLAPRLLERLRSDPGGGDFLETAGALEEWGRRDEVVAVLREHVARGRLTGASLYALASVGPDGAALVRAHWTTWVRSDDPRTRAAALELLGDLGVVDPGHLATFVGRLDDPAPEVVVAALRRIEALGDAAVSSADDVMGAIARSAARAEDASGRDRTWALQIVERGLAVVSTFGPRAQGLAPRLRGLATTGDDGSRVLPRGRILDALVAVGGSDDDLAGSLLTGAPADPDHAIALFAAGTGELDARWVAGLWEIARTGRDPRPAAALDALGRRGALGVASLPTLVDLIESATSRCRATALRHVARLLPALDDPDPTIERLAEWASDDDLDVAAVAVETLRTLHADDVDVIAPLVRRVPRKTATARVLGYLGIDAIPSLCACLARLDVERHAAVETAFLSGVRDSATNPRAVCRAWLETRYGAFGTRTGLPRDIPKERSDLLRWAIYEATVVE